MTQSYKDRLNSNIFKNIFPEEVLDVEYLERLKQDTISSFNEIRYSNHGFNVNDVILRYQWTERQYQDIYRDVMEDVMEDIFENCPNLTACTIVLSYANNGYLNTSTKQEKVRITITGGTDAWNRKVTKTLTVTGAYSLTRVSDGVYDAVFKSPGTFMATIECKSAVSSLPIVRNVQTITILNSNGTSTSSGSFSGTSLNSGWLPATIEKGSYIDKYTFSLKVNSGHSSSSDSMYVLGKKTNGQIFVIADFFKSANNMKLQSSVTVGYGNLSSVQRTLSGNLTLENDIRQICFRADSPGHAGCVTGASISFNYDFCYNENLYNQDSGISGSVNSKIASWVVTGSNTNLSTKRKIGERKIGERKIGEAYVRTDLVKEDTGTEYQKALATPKLFGYHNNDKTDRITFERIAEYKIVGIVTSIKSKDIFTVMDEGYLNWLHLDFDDTTILYLSDKNPGKMCHYREIDNMTYIPIAIYTDDSIIINILDGVSGSKLAPYEKPVSDTQDFENYTQAELDSVVTAIWGVP